MDQLFRSHKKNFDQRIALFQGKKINHDWTNAALDTIFPHLREKRLMDTTLYFFYWYLQH